MNDLVSVIMPSYNTERFIKESIDSVLNQTYSNLELIIVDDCSTDQTFAIASAYSDDRIRLLKNDANSGAAVSRNRALTIARGKYVAFLDSDDVWSCNKLERQIAFMQRNGYHFSYTYYFEMDENDAICGPVRTGPGKITNFGMHLFNFMGCLTVIYDREYVGLVQVADIRKRNDYALWVKVGKKCPAYGLKEVLAKYRVRSTDSIMERGKGSLNRLKYNYQMWRKSEQLGVLASFLLTAVNLVFGTIKKVVYKKELKSVV